MSASVPPAVNTAEQHNKLATEILSQIARDVTDSTARLILAESLLVGVIASIAGKNPTTCATCLDIVFTGAASRLLSYTAGERENPATMDSISL